MRRGLDAIDFQTFASISMVSWPMSPALMAMMVMTQLASAALTRSVGEKASPLPSVVDRSVGDDLAVGLQVLHCGAQLALICQRVVGGRGRHVRDFLNACKGATNYRIPR